MTDICTVIEVVSIALR